jgi:hypothetical protein
MNWIKESYTRSKSIRNHYKLHNIDIFIKDSLPKNIDPDNVFTYISNRIPQHLLNGVDIIYIGEFKVFKERDINAIYEDGAIYVTNAQDSEHDLIDDIIHEIAHSVEERYTELIYEDSLLKKEFLGKRERLFWILQSNDYKPYSKIRNTFVYDEQIDLYFYKEVGYEAMWNIVTGLFPSPYSATSLREYFAIGFEDYYIGDRASLKRDCSILFSKLKDLDFMED